MILVIKEETGMSAEKPRKEVIASSSSELGDIVAGHGSIAYAITDATLNIYDEESEEWTAVQAGGGGGGSGDNYFVVTITGTTPDKTESDIVNAYSQGKNIYAIYSNNLYMFTNTDSDGVHFASIKQNTSAISKIRIKGSTMYLSSVATVPTASSSDNGSELIVKNGGWSKQQKKFIVTLTPTAQDYSGTMDKTVAEIKTAYDAGQQIVFRIMMSETNHMDMDCTARWFDDASYPSFNAYILVSEDTTNMLVFVFTSSTNDGAKQTYHTRLYPLTPLS